ncbi:MAG: translesion error-prone DNA polymerase V autoproteolytic subunit [Rickettsiales bacterium]|jgi:DNA polymerase V|nr:translesion error-prone DNA polymerase V autoproteolytic subunit [Rickettsiales bacterium]
MNKIYLASNSAEKSEVYQLPLQGCKVEAGFPSFVDDYIEDNLDLNKYLIKHPTATFFVRVSGDSMLGVGIHNNDLLIVDRSLTPSNDKIVIAAIEGALTVKRLVIKNNKAFLYAENDKFPPITINSETGAHIWGVVTNVIHPL